MEIRYQKRSSKIQEIQRINQTKSQKRRRYDRSIKARHKYFMAAQSIIRSSTPPQTNVNKKEEILRLQIKRLINKEKNARIRFENKTK